MNNKLTTSEFESATITKLTDEAKQFVEKTLGEKASKIRVIAPKRSRIGDIFTVTGLRFVEITGNSDYQPASFTTSIGSQVPANCFAAFVDLGNLGPEDVALAAFMLRESKRTFRIASDSPEWQKERKVKDGENERTIEGYLRHDWKIEEIEAPEEPKQTEQTEQTEQPENGGKPARVKK